MYILSGRFCPNVWIGVEFGVEIFRNREVCRNKKRSTEALLCVVLPGFEPRQAEPKTAVLPLHHKTITCSQGRSPQPRDKVTHKIAHDQIFPRF